MCNNSIYKAMLSKCANKFAIYVLLCHGLILIYPKKLQESQIEI